MSLWRLPEPLLLASRSSARLAVLRGAGLPVEARPVAIDERAIEAEARGTGAAPDDVARVLAQAKALAASALAPGRVVLGADQTLALGGDILHKPPTLEAARAQVRQLAGRTHVLHAAVAIVRDEEVLFETVETAQLTMRDLSDEAIESYFAAAGPQVIESVGAYQIEGPGLQLFERIDGDHFTILGLPILPVLACFRSEGWVP
ncbi:putative maf protein [Azorhizobium caulinodans ORS 571]|uniref:Nucleoside triphosphate pyrophosphatase n=1 Tax=Azorhizobium caulinodans (strain ATCC 43989 / DSM 5975 / JCM 20966 / LMG 6465 / NBRC 14845 / NCIMB 13405 / ORS 571) TaxID=438753 RepID=A8IFY4_AZOC5|nr:Maf family protein [Azorhizobium caulinodans]BAF86000.1 putative maf protein [Azorhizobium caulinodans ORS 571]